MLPTTSIRRSAALPDCSASSASAESRAAATVTSSVASCLRSVCAWLSADSARLAPLHHVEYDFLQVRLPAKQRGDL